MTIDRVQQSEARARELLDGFDVGMHAREGRENVSLHLQLLGPEDRAVLVHGLVQALDPAADRL